MHGLNDKQYEACCCTDGPLLVLAGAGSGKTRTLIHRIAYLMDEKGVNPYNILAITFTNKAAKEMRERVDRMVGFGAESIWVSTFHSMCVRILRKHIDKIGGTSDFSIYDTDEQKTVIRMVLKQLDMDPKLYPERMLLSIISKAKEGYISPDDYEREHASSYRDQQIASVYREYQRRLKKNNALDFDDLIYQTIFLFETNPDVLAEYQERFKYIMVDEYQDTNHTQFLLVKMLADKYKNICVVGDDDQSIYKFRGANIYNILNFENQYPDAKVVKLEQNYRSTANILNAANAVIANNEGRKDKTLWTDKEAGEKLTFNRYETEHAEAAAIASNIRGIKSKGVSLDDIAILYRTNAQSRVLEEKLMFENIPYKVYGGQNFYSRKEIRDVVSYMKVLLNGSDDEAFKRIINVPKRGIGATTVTKLTEYADDNGINLYDALLDIEEVPGMARNVDKINKFTSMLDDVRSRFFDGTLLSEAFDYLLDKTGYVAELDAEATDEAAARKENLLELKNKIINYEEETDEPTLRELLEDIALVAEADSKDEDESVSKITLMTLHSSKGLEFPYVFISGMEDGLFPSRMSLDSDDPDALEEERRLCYVGITRAMKKLYLSAATTRMVNGCTNRSDISRFVKEIPRQYIDIKGLLSHSPSKPSERDEVSYAVPSFGKAFPIGDKFKTKSNAMAAFSPGADNDYHVGDEVKHIKFGKGVVRSVLPAGSDMEIVVNFERVGEKRMFASLVKMKKL